MNQSVRTAPQAAQDTVRAPHQPHVPLPQLDPGEEQALRRRLGSWSHFHGGVSAQDFDDVYQDAWCKLLEGERKGRPTRNREGALRWAVRNSWLEELRRRRRRPAVDLDSAPEAALVANRAADPAERAELLEAARCLFEAGAPSPIASGRSSCSPTSSGCARARSTSGSGSANGSTSSITPARFRRSAAAWASC
jgi:Sigma-70 region 2